MDLLLKECQFPPAMITGPERVTSSEPGLQGDRDSFESEGLAMTDQRLACGGYTYEGGHQAMTSLRQVYGREVEEKPRTFEGRPGQPRIMLVAVVVGIGCPKDLSARAKVSSGWLPIWCNCKTNVG